MIITKQKPFEEILKHLEGEQKVFLVGCGDCSTVAKTGGDAELEDMKQRLEAAGKAVTGFVKPDAPCVASQIKMAFAKNRKAIEEADSILALCCGEGIQSIVENDRKKKSVHIACDTLFGGIVDATGKGLFECCSMCGECILEVTGGICPITLCSKGLLNGPCGGADKGKCEVDKERDCAWILIFNKLKESGRLDLISSPYPPKDHSKAAKPRKRILV